MSLKNTDVRTPGEAAIAKKFKLSLARVRQLIDQGAKHEKEHNTNLSKAKQVARDHIGERPDYYKMLNKAEKTDKNHMKEETATTGVGGLGFVTGTPAVNGVNAYINTNAMSYFDENGNKLDSIVKAHTHLHNSYLGYNAFSAKNVGANKNFIKEAKLNELGEYDNKGGMPGYEETTGPIRAVRKRDVKEQSPANPSYKERPMYEKSTGKAPSDMTGGIERGIYQEAYKSKDELYGFNHPKTGKNIGRIMPSYGEFQTRRVRAGTTQGVFKNHKTREDAEKHLIQHADSTKQVEEEDNTKPDVNLMGNQKPDAYGYGAKGTTKTIHEETKMDNKELINEALDCILEDNLPEMKDNLMKALQEKAMEKLEERKKEIAANYFAQ